MSEKSIILLANTQSANLEHCMQFLQREGFHIRGAGTLAELDNIIEKQANIGLVVVFLSGFDSGIWERIDHLRDMHIPFLIVAPQRSMSTQEEAMNRGARGILIEPLTDNELLENIRSLFVV